MKAIKLIIGSLVIAASASQLFAQSETNQSYETLTPELQQILTLRAKERVGQMNDNIAYMADKDKKEKIRYYFREKALNLFIGRGDEYTLGGVYSDGVKMQTTSIYNKKPRPQLMKRYFTRLINLNYVDVEIEGTDIVDMDVSALRKINDDLYVCSVCFVQKFRGIRGDGRADYVDRTRKEATVYVVLEETIDRKEPAIYIGDVYAKETF